MILNRAITSDLGHWNLGTAELVLNFGHNEYGLPNTSGDPKALDIREAKASERRQLVEADDWTDSDDFDWSEVLTVSGPVYVLAKSFYLLSVDLDPHMDPVNYTPGGDDDTFDYWPSGMRLLYALACDLDQLIPERVENRLLNPGRTRYRDRYGAVLQNAKLREVPELEGSVPLA